MALEHQQLCLKDCLVRERKVYSHLVTIEVSIERCTCQWVQLDSLTLNKLWLEGLNTETVKCWSTVQENWMSLHDILKNIIYDWLTTVNNTLCTLYRLHDTTLNKLTNDEWLVQFCSHKLWQTALTHIQFRTNDDNRTCRIIDTLTEEVLTETSCLTLQGIR